jgi:MATE family multidrug resistance protein
MEAAPPSDSPFVWRAPTARSLLGLAWPIVVSRSSQVVVGVSDAIMVAALGEAALAATTAGALNTFALLILPMGTVFIVSSFSAQLLGKNDAAGARRHGLYGLGLAAATQVLCLAALAGLGPALGLFPYAPDVRVAMHEYLFLRLLSGGAAIGIEALGNYYGGLGRTRLPMVANVAAMALNVLGNWMLIQGHLGAPALGVRGAALASTLATWIAFLGLLTVFLAEGRRTPVGPLRLREALRMLRFGLPSGFNWMFEFLAFHFFINVVVAGLGTTALAAMMVVIQINSVSFMPAFGVASAGAILVGQAIGAGAKDAVPGAVRLTFFVAAIWQGLVGLAYVLVPGALLLAFAPPGAEGEALRSVGVRLLMLSAAWQLFDSAATTIAEALRAAGDTAYTMWARSVIAWLVFAPGSYVTVRHLGWGDAGAVGWLVLYLGLLSGVLFLRFRNGAWRRVQLTEPAVLA